MLLTFSSLEASSCDARAFLCKRCSLIFKNNVVFEWLSLIFILLLLIVYYALQKVTFTCFNKEFYVFKFIFTGDFYINFVIFFWLYLGWTIFLDLFLDIIRPDLFLFHLIVNLKVISFWCQFFCFISFCHTIVSVFKSVCVFLVLALYFCQVLHTGQMIPFHLWLFLTNSWLPSLNLFNILNLTVSPV